jgi:triosephosphate isomerase
MKYERAFLAANWKMHLTLTSAQALASEVVGMYRDEIHFPIPVVLCVPAPFLAHVAHLTKPALFVGAQNVHESEKGAYTGEISADMIKSCGATHVIVGHSERRILFGETNPRLQAKLRRSLDAGLTPIFCVGETLAEREKGTHERVVIEQLDSALDILAHGDTVIWAYEPVWAIGTGRNATPEDAQAMHALIRARLRERFGEMADQTPILYGGSVNAENAKALFSMPDVDGGLVGGASLDARSFINVLKALTECRN